LPEKRKLQARSKVRSHNCSKERAAKEKKRRRRGPLAKEKIPCGRLFQLAQLTANTRRLLSEGV
jgi:hypothetical protein